MAICNRDLDLSQQIYPSRFRMTSVATGATVAAAYIDTPATLQKLAITGYGVSGAPVYTTVIHRWTSSGLTSISLGGLTLTGNYGVSGSGVSATFNSGSSLTKLQSGDVLLLVASGANTNALELIGEFVLQATQDIKTTFGV